jgi:hypothetical protein
VALGESAVHPFSQSEAAAASVAALQGTVIAVRDEAAVPVAAYAARPLDLADGQPAPTDYITWDQARLCAGRRCNTTQLLEGAMYEAGEDSGAGPVYVLTDFEVPPGTVGLVLVRAWTGAVVNEEDYWLYVYEP